MPKTLCCVPVCNNRGGHLFPRDLALRKRWIVAVKRDNFKPTATSVVCKSHFKPDDYTQETYYGQQPLKQTLKRDAVPSVFNWTAVETAAAIERRCRAQRRQSSLVKPDSLNCEATAIEICDIGCELTISERPEPDDRLLAATSATQNVTTTKSAEHATQTSAAFPCLSVEKFVLDPAAIHYYTGLENYSKFCFVLSTLGPAAYCLNYRWRQCNDISVENQFFLTLIKLRLHTPNFELSRMFDVSEFSVGNVFVTWINFMALQWRELNMWPSRDLVKYFMPNDFRKKFPATRVIIDGMECPIKKPKCPTTQQATFSTYKNRNTLKVVVGASPGGLITHVPMAYGGSASDRQLVERGGLMCQCDAKDSVMADKGFNVQDMFAAKDISINIPTFMTGKNRLSGMSVIRDRKIASKRVHIERIIGLVKTYKILQHPMNETETALGSEIIFVCCMLCNFRTCIVPKTA